MATSGERVGFAAPSPALAPIEGETVAREGRRYLAEFGPVVRRTGWRVLSERGAAPTSAHG